MGRGNFIAAVATMAATAPISPRAKCKQLPTLGFLAATAHRAQAWITAFGSMLLSFAVIGLSASVPTPSFAQVEIDNQIYTVAFSPDGTRVLAGGSGKELMLLNAATGELVHLLQGHTSLVYSAVFSPDGARIVSASGDKTLKLWDVATGELIRTFAGHTDLVVSAAFSPDGRHIVSASHDHMLKLWDAATGALIRTTENADEYGATFIGYGATFFPDGTRILARSGDVLKIWDAATGQLLSTFVGHVKGVWSIAISPDGARILVGGSDKTLKLLDGTTGQLLRTYVGHSAIVSSVSFSYDGARVLSGSYDQTVKLWDAASGQLLRTFSGHTGEVTSTAFSPDAKRVLSGSDDYTMKLWNAASGQLLRTMKAMESRQLCRSECPVSCQYRNPTCLHPPLECRRMCEVFRDECLLKCSR